MTGIDPLRLGRDAEPPSRPAANPSPERTAARIEQAWALPPPDAAQADGHGRGAARAEPPGLSALILATIAPRQFDRRLLQPDRLQAILGDTLAELDRAPGTDEIAELASAVIAEELARHLALARVRETEATLPVAEAASP